MYPLLCTLFEKRAVTKWPELSDESIDIRSKSPSNFNGFLPGFDKLQKAYEFFVREETLARRQRRGPVNRFIVSVLRVFPHGYIRGGSVLSGYR